VNVPGELVRLAVRVRASDAELTLARLLPLLSGGAEERAVGEAVEYALYGPAGELPDEASLRALAGDALLGVTSAPVAGGWESAWHAHLGRVEAGGFAIRPPWVAGPPDDIVIEPGLTFGAAGHPTTRLCLELLAATAQGSDPLSPRALRGQTPLGGGAADWGCGSGVLAICAARAGFGPVLAVDVDPAAVALTRENSRANEVEVDARRGDVAKERPWAPTVVANLTLPLLQAAAALDGPKPERLIASGVLAGQADAVVAAWSPMRERERREDDGWAALLLEAA
jgi:ribosomal protein L11 methyltransferase